MLRQKERIADILSSIRLQEVSDKRLFDKMSVNDGRKFEEEDKSKNAGYLSPGRAAKDRTPRRIDQQVGAKEAFITQGWGEGSLGFEGLHETHVQIMIRLCATRMNALSGRRGQ